ncbi:MAG: TonB-dependent receptor [Pseudomonadales bacterium]|nr:TonB-dependent receptor [Pseudomonadales bacterium]
MFAKRPLIVAIGSILSTQAYSQSSPDSLEEIVVTGSRASLMSAINKQRNADKVAGVVDSDALGNFADINVAESLRRISGIMVENDQGEGRYVSVRGMNADLNAMTINGVSTSTPEDRRGILLDGVPSDLLESMTVYKTLTPNLDADTIGGAIDLETVTAFSYSSMFNRIKVESSYNDLTEDSSNPKLSATFANHWQVGDGELGAAFVLSDQTRHIVAHNNENGGWSESAPNDDYEMRFYDLEKERRGLVANFDYRSNNGNSYYFHLFRNEYVEEEWRTKWETKDGLEDNDPVVNGSVFSYADSKVDSEGKNRTETRDITTWQLGAELQIASRHRMDIEVFGSKAEQDDTDRYEAKFRSSRVDSPITYDNANPRSPVVNFPSEFYDPALFELKTWEAEFGLVSDEDAGAKVDMYYDWSNSTQVQYGLKYRQREKRNDYEFCGYEPLEDSTLAEYAYTTPDQFLNTVSGPTPTFDQVKAFRDLLGSGNSALSDGTLCPNPGAYFEFSGDEEEESVPADWYTDEDVFASYLMATTESNDFTWVYGIRFEDTETSYRGKNFDGDAFTGDVNFDNDYSFWAPSLNVKYDLSADQLLRFGAFRSLVRPGFKESCAGAKIDVEDNEIEGGNPNLDPTTAWNFDLTYEYYLGLETFFGAGLFYKTIQDPIVEVEATDTSFRGQQWDVAGTFINSDDTDLQGFELSFQTAMENGLIFVANYTYTDGDTYLPTNSVYGQRTVPFFKLAEQSGNLSFGYNKGSWDVRLAANYRSEYLDEIGDDDLFDRYTDDHLQVDFTARYEYSDNLTLTAEAINLNDEPQYYYFGNSRRLSQYDEFGTTYGMGLRYSF